MPTPPLNTSYRSYRPAPGGGNRPAGPQGRPVGTAPISGVSVPQKSDLVSPQYTPTPVRTNTRAISSGNPRAQTPRNKVVVQKTRQVVTRTRVSQEERRSSPPLKGGNLLFFLVLGLAVSKDLFDLLALLLDAIGVGLSATVIGAVVGIPLAIFSEVLSKFAALAIGGTILFYFWFTGGKFALRLVVMSIGAIIDAVPVLNALPITSITFVFAFIIGRAISKVESSVLGGAATSVIAKRI